MNVRLDWRAPVLALLVAGCSTTVLPTPTTAPPPPTATPGVVGSTFAPPPPSTPEPTPYNQDLPPTTRLGWWSGPSTGCQPPAFLRMDGKVTPIGSCPGAWLSPTSPRKITLDPGESIELHMAVPADNAPPTYPLPVAEDETVALGWLIYDDATMRYSALLPGTTRLVSDSDCLPGFGPTPPPTPVHPCPVLEIHVRDSIDLDCGDFDLATCRLAAAAAMPNGDQPQTHHVAGLRVEPSSLLGPDYCGEIIALVTITLRDQAGEYGVSIGRYPNASADPPRYVPCTY